MGVQAKRIYRGRSMDVYSRPLTPDHSGRKSVAVAFLNKKTAGTNRAHFKLTKLGLDSSEGYRATEIFSGKDLGFFKPEDTFREDVKGYILLVNFLSQK